jgi:hypothetical protein
MQPVKPVPQGLHGSVGICGCVGSQFVCTSLQQLRFDPTIIAVGDKRYIETKRDNGTKRLVIDKVIKRVRRVADRATTCWKV